MAVWAALLIEKWKRKEKHLSLVWGIVSPEENSQLIPNLDFKGYAKYSWINHKSTKKSTDVEGKVMMSINYLISVVLLLASVAVYIFCKE